MTSSTFTEICTSKSIGICTSTSTSPCAGTIICLAAAPTEHKILIYYLLLTSFPPIFPLPIHCDHCVQGLQGSLRPARRQRPSLNITLQISKAFSSFFFFLCSCLSKKLHSKVLIWHTCACPDQASPMGGFLRGKLEHLFQKLRRIKEIIIKKKKSQKYL